jgi:hypothetical protein
MNLLWISEMRERGLFIDPERLETLPSVDTTLGDGITATVFKRILKTTLFGTVSRTLVAVKVFLPTSLDRNAPSVDAVARQELFDLDFLSHDPRQPAIKCYGYTQKFEGPALVLELGRSLNKQLVMARRLGDSSLGGPNLGSTPLNQRGPGYLRMMLAFRLARSVAVMHERGIAHPSMHR